MHNIQEKDWAEDDWSGYTGMDSDSSYCTGPPINEGKKLEEKGANEKSAQQPFAIHYEFIRRGEVEIIFSFQESKMPVRALFFTDPLLDLTESALQLHNGTLAHSVVFINNSGEHQLVFKHEQERELTFEIRWFEKRENLGQTPLDDDYVVAFSGSTTVDAYILQVFEILEKIDRKLGEDQYKTKWINAEFPREAYGRLKIIQDCLR